MPWPFSRKTWPFCVPSGIFSRTAPVIVGTCASPPSTAVVTGTATLRVQVVALALEHRVRPRRGRAGRDRRQRRRWRPIPLRRRRARASRPSRRPECARPRVRAWPPSLIDIRRVAPWNASSSVSSTSCSMSLPLLRAARPRPPRAGRALAGRRRRRTSGRSRRTDPRCRRAPASPLRSSCGSRRRPPMLMVQAPAAGRRRRTDRRQGWPCCCACSYIRQLAPSSSYLRRLSGSPSTSYASLISLNVASADLSPGFTSGWSLRASLRYACLISFSEAVLATPSVW